MPGSLRLLRAVAPSVPLRSKLLPDGIHVVILIGVETPQGRCKRRRRLRMVVQGNLWFHFAGCCRGYCVRERKPQAVEVIQPQGKALPVSVGNIFECYLEGFP